MQWNYFWLLSVVVPSFRFVAGEFKLQILHTNDLHARFKEVDEYAGPCTPANAKEGKCYGGFARIKKLADRMKEEASKQNISSIFLNAGDTFQGTPHYNYYKWKIAAVLVNTLGLDAMCLGNHEFDDGIDNLVQFLKNVNTPTVTVNLNRSTDERLNQTLVKNSIVLDVKGHKLGIIGYLKPNTMTTSKTEGLQILEEIPCLRKEAQDLKSQGVNFIIALGHSGFGTDKQIAEEVEEVDVIVGGHSHTLLYNPKDNPPTQGHEVESYPFWITQKSGKRVPIVQSSAFSMYFGILTLTLDDKYTILSAEGNSYLLNDTYEKDHAVEKIVDEWSAPLSTNLNINLSTFVGQTRVNLTSSFFNNKNEFESNFGNLITDALFYQGVLRAKVKNSNQWTEHAIAFYPNGGIRIGFAPQRNQGNLTLDDIYTAMPFHNNVCQCRIFGKEIRQVLETCVQSFKPTDRYLPYFLHFSGLRVTYDLRRPPGDRVTEAMVLCTQCSVPHYETLKSNETYNVILVSYLAQGGDTFTVFKQSCKDVENFGTIDTEVVADYIRKQQIIYPALDGRITVLEEN